MTRPRQLIAVAAVLSVVAIPAAVAGASASHASFWTNRAATADCGVRITLKRFELLCAASGVPRPKHPVSTGDPFVVLAQTGRPQLVLLSQDEFPGGSPKTLSNGSTWSKNGIRCTLARKVRCTNRSHHGFTIGNGRYVPF